MHQRLQQLLVLGTRALRRLHVVGGGAIAALFSNVVDLFQTLFSKELILKIWAPHNNDNYMYSSQLSGFKLAEKILSG